MSNFAFLPTKFRRIAEPAGRAEGHIMGDPRAACFHARFTLEALVLWLYRHDSSLRMPYDSSLGALLHEPTFQNLLPQAVFQKTRVIQKVGNQAVHNPRPVRQYDALQAVQRYGAPRITRMASNKHSLGVPIRINLIHIEECGSRNTMLGRGIRY